MKKASLFFILLLFCSASFAQSSSQDKKMEWWREARFGMFIHWGVYAVPAGNYHGFQQKKRGSRMDYEPDEKSGK